MLRTRSLLAVSLASLAFASGCESLDPCAGIANPAMRVRVQEASTLIPIAAGATLKITHGGAAELYTFPADPSANDDVYESQFEQPGAYEVEASRVGYVTTTSRFTVNRAACNSAMQRSVTILMPRAP